MIAAQLGISEITVKAHRGKVMLKMRVRSLAELVTVAARLRRGAGREDPSPTKVLMRTNVQSPWIAGAHTVSPS